MKKLLLASAFALTAIVPAMAQEAIQPPSSQAFQDGFNARQGWEAWFTQTQGDYHAGAFYWSAERSKAHPGSCAALGGDATAGCVAAQFQLRGPDVRRKSEPDYKTGWNWPIAGAVAQAPQVQASVRPAYYQTPVQTPVYRQAATPVSNVLTAADLPALVQASKNNEMRFDRDYVGRAFRSEGTFDSVGTIFGSAMFHIKVGYNDAVICKIGDQATLSAAADWNKGQRVMVTGTVEDTIMGSLSLKNDCRIQAY